MSQASMCCRESLPVRMPLVRGAGQRRRGFFVLLVALALGVGLGIVCTYGMAMGDVTDGPAWSEPSSVSVEAFQADGSISANDVSIDVSSVSSGVVGAQGVSTSRLKLLVEHDGMSYSYDLPADGSAIEAPINMGNGTYTFSVMRNTSGSDYARIDSTTADVTLDSEFAPYLQPNVYCDYTTDSACVAKARELASGAANEGDVVRAVCSYVTQDVAYDTEKAERLSDATGYVPDPDATLAEGSGICFDRASLATAMLRSLGIPTKLVTGYVGSNGTYHAWIMVYINGTWTSSGASVGSETWSRIDLASMDSASTGLLGDGTSYTDRFTY